MATAPSQWALKVLDVLADGEWHPLNEVLDAATPYVPPGIAARHAERGRINHGGPPHRSKGDQQKAIDVGARSKVHEAINIRVRYHTLERRRHDGNTELRSVSRQRSTS